MTGFDRHSGGVELFDLELVEEKRTPGQLVELGIKLYLVGLSISYTKWYFDKLGIKRSRTVVHNWVQKVDLRPTGDRSPNQIEVEKAMI